MQLGLGLGLGYQRSDTQLELNVAFATWGETWLRESVERNRILAPVPPIWAACMNVNGAATATIDRAQPTTVSRYIVHVSWLLPPPATARRALNYHILSDRSIHGCQGLSATGAAWPVPRAVGFNPNPCAMRGKSNWKVLVLFSKVWILRCDNSLAALSDVLLRTHTFLAEVDGFGPPRHDF